MSAEQLSQGLYILIFVEEILTHPLGSIAWEACRPHPAEH